jgi:hypothetical protein
MANSRRHWLIGFAGVFSALALQGFAEGQLTPSPRPMPSPNAPDPHAPAGLDRPPMASSNPKGINPQLEQEIRTDVQKLFALASDLKQQVESTDLNSVLSIGVVKKAQQIEKLAKQIKDHAKG